MGNRTAWNKGKKMPEGFGYKIRKIQLGKNNTFYGKKHKEESKRKMSLANTNKICDEKTKRIMSESHKGTNNGNWKGGK